MTSGSLDGGVLGVAGSAECDGGTSTGPGEPAGAGSVGAAGQRGMPPRAADQVRPPESLGATTVRLVASAHDARQRRPRPGPWLAPCTGARGRR